MKVVVLHNPNAGDGSDREEVLGELANRGLTVLAVSDSSDDLEEHLASAEAAVVVGGDGTVRELLVALRQRGPVGPDDGAGDPGDGAGGPENTMSRRSGAGVPVVIVPFGTANNVARSLGIPLDDPYATATDLREGGRIVGFDVGEIRVADDVVHFVESVGGGVIAQGLRDADEIDTGPGEAEVDGNAVGRAQIRRRTRRVQPSRWEVIIDGQDRSTELVGLEVMNTPSVGPNVELAPAARPDDRLLSVVLVKDADRTRLAEAVAAEDTEPLWDLVSYTARDEIRFRPPRGTVMHIDDEFVEDAHRWWSVTPGAPVAVLRGGGGPGAPEPGAEPVVVPGVEPTADQTTDRS